MNAMLRKCVQMCHPGDPVRESLMDWVFPRTCICCGALISGGPPRFTCPSCRRHYVYIRRPFCGCCGVPFFGKLVSDGICGHCREKPPRFSRARSLFLYRGTGGRLVHTLKYEQGTYLLAEIAALFSEEGTWRSWFANAVLVPVPLHPFKHWKRGFNQAEIIARAIGRACPETTLAACLRRNRMTPSQTFLSREARIRNMRGAFRCHQQPPGGRPVIVVDDVLTTGATLNSAVTALRKAGVHEVAAFTLAHG